MRESVVNKPLDKTLEEHEEHMGRRTCFASEIFKKYMMKCPEEFVLFELLVISNRFETDIQGQRLHTIDFQGILKCIYRKDLHEKKNILKAQSGTKACVRPKHGKTWSYHFIIY